MSLRSPLGKVLGRGSAGEGVHHWWVQRVTAVALIPLLVWFGASVLSLPLHSYEAVRGWLGQPWVALLTILLLFTLVWHSKLGVEVVIEDYAHTKGMKTTLLLVSAFVHVLAGAAGIFAVLMLALS